MEQLLERSSSTSSETEEKKVWGYHLLLDLKKADLNLIKDELYVKEFAIRLCDLIGMKRFGDPWIKSFGDTEDVSGFTLFQPIFTSNVCAHFVDQNGSIFLDVFSCKEFDPEIAIDFTSQWFKTTDYVAQFFRRY